MSSESIISPDGEALIWLDKFLGFYKKTRDELICREGDLLFEERILRRMHAIDSLRMPESNEFFVQKLVLNRQYVKVYPWGRLHAENAGFVSLIEIANGEHAPQVRESGENLLCSLSVKGYAFTFQEHNALDDNPSSYWRPFNPGDACLIRPGDSHGLILKTGGLLINFAMGLIGESKCGVSERAQSKFDGGSLRVLNL